uniref:Glutathione peroxidase 4a n=1 Tax=Salmo trutta TaxID=8032 RepID=A0A673YIV8_SALTR
MVFDKYVRCFGKNIRPSVRIQVTFRRLWILPIRTPGQSKEEVDPLMACVKSIYDFSAETLDGQSVPLSNYRGKVLLIVNLATF